MAISDITIFQFLITALVLFSDFSFSLSSFLGVAFLGAPILVLLFVVGIGFELEKMWKLPDHRKFWQHLRAFTMMFGILAAFAIILYRHFS